MKKVPVVVVLLTIFACASSAFALDCGPPPQQFTNNVDAEGKIAAQGLLKKLFEGSAEGKVSIVAQDLLSKYPNSDKTIIVLGLLSMYCQIIGTSGASESEKLQMLGKANEELLKWESVPHSEETLHLLKSEIRELANFPNSPGTQPPTLLQTMSIDKLPFRLFVLLGKYNEGQMRTISNRSAQLYAFKKDYYEFQEKLIDWENNAVTRIGQLVKPRFRQAWVICLPFVIMRFDGQSKEGIAAQGYSLNYDITLDDAERVFEELSTRDASFAASTKEIFAMRLKMSDEARKAISDI